MPDEVRVISGFRASRYGIRPFPEPVYWASVGREIAARLQGGVPGGIWILGPLSDRGGCALSFPGDGKTYENITFAAEDLNEAVLRHFDAEGVKVWLQVEPGHAEIPPLIDLVLSRYKHHPSVIGFGIDVEWHQSTSPSEGVAITDAQASAWVEQIRRYSPDYTLMLKHWLIEKMPPTARDGLFFLDDSQIFKQKQELVTEFMAWGKAFAPAPVGFQIGYPADRPWWSRMRDPVGELGNELIAKVPNTTGIFWVDFSIDEIFPPPGQVQGQSS